METVLEARDGSPNCIQGDERPPPASGTVAARVFAYLDAHPEFARRPSAVADFLHVNRGSAKRLVHEWRRRQRPGLDALLGPVLLQNVRLVGRTDPGGGSPGSPALAALGSWLDRGDHKLTATVGLPHLNGRAEVSLAGDTLELCLSSPRGFTPSEVLLVLALLRLPFDRSAEVSLAQLEVFRDGDAARFEGVEARTYRNAEGLLWKAYNHTDARGTLARLEVRPPAVGLTWSELEAFFEARQPLGRDAKVDALALQVRENSEAVLMLRREVRRALRAIGSLGGSDTSKGGSDGAVR